MKGQPSSLNALPLCHSLAPLLSRKPHLLSGRTPFLGLPTALATCLSDGAATWVLRCLWNTGHPSPLPDPESRRREPGRGTWQQPQSLSAREPHSLRPHGPCARGGFPRCVSEEQAEALPKGSHSWVRVRARPPPSEPLRSRSARFRFRRSAGPSVSP